MPSNTPQVNRYVDGEKQPDPVGTALAWVEFKLIDMFDGRELHKTLLDHNAGKLRGGMTSSDSELWNRISPGTSIRVKLEAEPVFFPYINEDGAALMQYANTNDGYVRGVTVSSQGYYIGLNQEGLVVIDGEVAPEPVEIIDPSVEEGDRIMREEREEYERKERELREKVSKQNEEANERVEREKRELEMENRRLQQREAELARRHDEKQALLDKQAADARKRLGISDTDQVREVLNNPMIEDGLYMALVNLWSAEYAPHDLDGYKKRLIELKESNSMSRFDNAINEIFKRLDSIV